MRPLLVSVVAFLPVLSVLADVPPVDIGPATRLAEFHTGAPGNDVAMAVSPRSAGFTVVMQHRTEIRSIDADSAPPPLYTHVQASSQRHLLESPEYHALFGLA